MLGMGLRSAHYHFLAQKPKTKINWFEAISENYIDTHGLSLIHIYIDLKQCANLIMHGQISSATS